MKKWIALLLALLLAATAAQTLAEGEKDALAEIRERGTLVIGTEGNWSPWTYHDESDTLTGFDVEIGTLIAEGLGVKPDFKEAAWESLLAGVETGRFDIICNGVGFTPVRAEKYAFSDPYAYTTAVLVVRKDNEDIKTLDDLKGKKTTNSPNSTYAMMAEERGADVQYVDTLGETLSIVENGRADATINAKGSIDDYLKEHPEANIKVALEFPGEAVAYPVRKTEKTESLVAAINDVLAKAREDGTLEALSIKYFGEDLTKAE